MRSFVLSLASRLKGRIRDAGETVSPAQVGTGGGVGAYVSTISRRSEGVSSPCALLRFIFSFQFPLLLPFFYCIRLHQSPSVQLLTLGAVHLNAAHFTWLEYCALCFFSCRRLPDCFWPRFPFNSKARVPFESLCTYIYI